MAAANRQPTSTNACKRMWSRETDTYLYRKYLIYICFYLLFRLCHYCTGNTDLQTTAYFPMQNVAIGLGGACLRGSGELVGSCVHGCVHATRLCADVSARRKSTCGLFGHGTPGVAMLRISQVLHLLRTSSPLTAGCAATALHRRMHHYGRSPKLKRWAALELAESLRAGQRAAAIMSLVQSAKQRARSVLRPTQSIRRIEEPLPHRWALNG